MFSTRSFRASILSLLGVALATMSASAQPISISIWTIEARVGKADHVVVGTIDKVSRKVIVVPGGPDKAGIIYPDGQFEYTVTIKVGEVLKGNLPGIVADLGPIHRVGSDNRYEEWAQARTSILWFLGPTPTQGERRHWDLLPLGKPVPAEDYFGGRRGPPYFSRDFRLLEDDAAVLACARAHARAMPQVQPIHSIRIPASVSRGSGRLDYLMVPVEPTLEQRAKRLIAAPQEFIPKGKELDAETRYLLRVGGVYSLRYFKSDANAELLRSLLDDPLEDFRSSYVRQKPVRVKAYEVLLHWGVETPVPKSAETITALDLAGTEVTDQALKQLGALRNLTTLDLQGTKVTAQGLKELAGLRKLSELGLSESQLSDATLRVLREIGLLHSLSQASAKAGQRPRSVEDIVSLALCRSPVTDAGLRELAGLRNLTWLDLRDTRVTDAGLKELAGLKNLATLLLQDTKVTDAGVAELLKALPNCSIKTGTE
jgi:hypothetical protein